jgi:glycosyltransferase involved in cell wall biosynthesis
MTKRPRVLMVSGHAPPVMDGVGDCTDRLLDELVRQRPDWGWFWLSKRPRWYQTPLDFRYGVTRIRPSHTWSRRGQALVQAAIRALRPDLVHIQEQIHSFHETDAACRIADAAGPVPVITTLHEYHIERPSVRYTSELVRRSTVLIANDPRNAERCLSETGRSVDHLWWSGCTVLPPDPQDKTVTVSGRLTTFGFLSAIKAIDPVAEAFRHLRPTHRELEWRIIGPFHPESDPHHAELARRVTSEGVTFTGGFSVRDTRLRRLLGETQVMLLPFADGASERRTSLHAAWVYGLPVITTPPPTANAAILDGENCLLVREPTPDAWAEAITRVLADRDLARRLSAGSLAAAERFSWKRLANLHLEMYDRLWSEQRLRNRANRAGVT